jgi:hypothetical protein
MATIIKLVLALLVLTAATQAGRAALTNYQFEDALHQALLFNPSAADDEIATEVMSIASEYGVPLQAEAITLREVGSDRIVDCSYTTTVEFIPGFYSRPMTFNSSASVRLLNPRRR